MKRIFVCGDIHGNHKALLQCIERSGINKEEDILIQLGDVVDGLPDSFQVVEELLSFKNLVAIRGNHDSYFHGYLNTGVSRVNWTQGGKATITSYINALKKGAVFQKLSATYTTLQPEDIPKTHVDFFNNQLPYFILDNILFVHGGFNRHFPLSDKLHNSDYILMWDRDLWNTAIGYSSSVTSSYIKKFRTHDDYSKIFIGHTSTVNYGTTEVMKAANLINIDTGAGYGGKLTFYELYTDKTFQSDTVDQLYPKFKMYGYDI